MKRIKYCLKCKRYTLQDICLCGELTVTKTPMKYSPVDKTAKYRIEARKKDLKERGLL